MIRELINTNIDNLELIDIINYQEKTDKQGKKNYTVVAVVKWFDNPPTLEKRNFYYNKEDKLMCGKAMGLKKADVEDVLSNENILSKL